MADNDDAIAELEENMNSGLASFAVDGVAVTLASLSDRRIQLGHLIENNTDGAGPRPRRKGGSATINVGGF